LWSKYCNFHWLISQAVMGVFEGGREVARCFMRVDYKRVRCNMELNRDSDVHWFKSQGWAGYSVEHTK
jgi:hypothetical protein